MNKNNLADNLRLLCNYKKSISEVCRELDINRQQFNKYLSGKTAPSGSNLRRICDYFGVEEYEIVLPPEEFENLIRIRPQVGATSVAGRTEYQCLDQLLDSSLDDLSKYEGCYHIYYYSTSFPGQIVKGFAVISRQDGRCFIKWIERLSQRKSSAHNNFIYKISGLVTALGNRIFISAYEQVLRSELVHITLYPTYKNKVSLLSGLMLGLSGSDSREPVCQRIMLAYLGKQYSHRQALKNCGVFPPDAPELDAEICRHIRNDQAEGEHVFSARPL